MRLPLELCNGLSAISHIERYYIPFRVYLAVAGLGVVLNILFL